MEDSPSRQLQALSAHVDGLRAALEALPTDPENAASLRRIARSLRSAAEAAGARELAAAARHIQDVDEERLAAAARAFLLEVEAVRERDAPGGLHVLLVEDNRTVATALQAYLKAPAYTVHHAATGAEAERILAAQPVDIVLLDLILPDRDGRDLLVQMREDARTADVPVLVLSAKEGAVPRAECLAVGAAEFLEKPVDPKVLRSAVARHARPHRNRTPTDGPAPRVPSRADLVEAYEPLRSEAERGEPAAVVLLAIDDLAQIVEGSGEDAADRLLTSIAGSLAAGLEGREMVGRWGRGQLVMLLPRASSKEAKGKVTGAMGRLAAAGVLDDYADAGIAPSFSAGVAVAEAGDQDLRDVVSAAEQSLLRARSGGRGLVVSPGDAEPVRCVRVMLVEDDRVTATLIHHRLEREGFEVRDFPNGEEAYEWAADASFDLAILDVKVPGMDGFELLERLRAIPRLKAVPIVMLTGLGGEADVVRGLELGANDYMLKPFSPTELLARVRRLVFARSAGGTEAGGPRGPRAEVGAR